LFILIVSRGYPNPTSPLRGIFELDQAKALQKEGNKVMMLSLDLRSIRRKRGWGKTVLFDDGVQIMNVSIPVGNVPAKLFVAIGKWIVGHISGDILARFGKPDIIHAHFSDIAAIAFPLKKFFHVPLVITEHNSKLNQDVIDSKTNYYSKTAYRNADKIISVSNALSKRLTQHFGANSIVISNIVDLQTFNYCPDSLKESFTYISTGNLIHRKGFDCLIKAFSINNLPKSRLLIIGEGPKKKNLQKQIDTLNLSNQIILVGKKTRLEINELFSKSDVFVLASRSETFGVVYIEAMAAGLPVIATKCGGPEEFVDAQNGILIDLNDTKQLSDALLEMKNNIHLYDREAIATSTRKNYSPEVIAGKLVKLYSEILQSKNH
jgi:glycosyltransferase involved in cell wall biosynthesis